MTPALFFTSPRPAVVDLPHLITAMDAELIGQVAHLTKSKPGLWGLSAPYDENDVFDPWRETAPFRQWELPSNQGELLALGRFAAEALFGTKAILLDSAIDEAAVLPLTDVRGQRRDNGGFYVEGLHDLPALPQLLKLTRWSLSAWRMNRCSRASSNASKPPAGCAATWSRPNATSASRLEAISCRHSSRTSSSTCATSAATRRTRSKPTLDSSKALLLGQVAKGSTTGVKSSFRIC